MLGLCFLVGEYASQKKREARERAQDPEGAPLVPRDTEGEARATDAANVKEN
jgi:hypothetical protein